jgi:hypothetical protein
VTSTPAPAGDALPADAPPAIPESPNAAARSAAVQAVDDAKTAFVTATDAFEAARTAAEGAPDDQALADARDAAEQDAADKGAAVDTAEAALAAIPPAPTA